MLARDAHLCRECLSQRLVTKVMSSVFDKERKLLVTPLPSLEIITDLCRSAEFAKSDDAKMDSKHAGL